MGLWSRYGVHQHPVDQQHDLIGAVRRRRMAEDLELALEETGEAFLVLAGRLVGRVTRISEGELSRRIAASAEPFGGRGLLDPVKDCQYAAAWIVPAALQAW